MKYKNTKNKIQKLWTQSQNINNNIKIETKKILKINNELKVVTPNEYSFNTIYKYYTNWENPIVATEEETNYFGGGVKHMWKEWTITFPKLNINWIPYIKYAIITSRNINYNNWVGEVTPSWSTKSVIFEVKDIKKDGDSPEEIENNIKKITMRIGWYLSAHETLIGISDLNQYKWEGLEDIQLKLIVELINPNLYK